MILLTKDSGGFAMPVLLDLTAAFDTAEHTLLMLHLNPMWASKVGPYSGPGPVYLREASQATLVALYLPLFKNMAKPTTSMRITPKFTCIYKETTSAPLNHD